MEEEDKTMTKHDETVLDITRDLLRKGEREITIGKKVVSQKKIVNQLRNEFPKKIIRMGR